MISIMAIMLLLLPPLPQPLLSAVTIPVWAYGTAQGARLMAGQMQPERPGNADGGPVESGVDDGVAEACRGEGIDLPRGRQLVGAAKVRALCVDGQAVAVLDGVEQVAVANVDGEEGPELVVNWRPKEEAPLRIHVYELGYGNLPPIWRGSKMSGDLESFTIVELKGKGPTLVTQERLGKVRRFVAHSWNNFGFIGLCSANIGPSGSATLTGCGETTLTCTEGPLPSGPACR